MSNFVIGNLSTKSPNYKIAQFLNLLHLVSPKVLVVEVLKHFAEVFGGEAFGIVGGELGGLEDVVFDKDGAIDAQRKRERVRGARIDADDSAVAFDPDHREEGVVAQFGHNYFANLRLETDQHVLDQVVRHGTRRGDLFDFESDGVGFVDAYPDRQDRIAANVFENHDGHVRYRIHHEPANFHFDFHRDPLARLPIPRIRLAATPRLRRC